MRGLREEAGDRAASGHPGHRPVSSFVFYPEGTYVGVRAIAIDQSINEVKEVSGPMVAKP